jgi:hypothetical protein
MTPSSSEVKLRRLPKWESLLDSFLHTNRSKSFQWGEWDCAIFSSKAIFAMTGTNLLSSLESTYSPEWAQSNASNIPTLMEPIVKEFELTACFPNWTHRGDLILLSNPPSDPCLGILGLNGMGVMVTGEGLKMVPRSRVLKGWHV